MPVQRSYTITTRCGCTVYVSCHPLTGLAHTRVIERRGPRCPHRHHDIGTRLWVWEILPESRPRAGVVQARAMGDAGEEGVAMAFADALRRAQADFLEMPGLVLTEAQAARLWCFDSVLCSRVLERLVELRFLGRSRRSTFARR
jgi:hypothetical protein